jgi:uncharacterized C2H2 Zn-finger protein
MYNMYVYVLEHWQLLYISGTTNEENVKIVMRRRGDVPENVFKCPNNCGRVYTLRQSLYSHLKHECGVPKQYRCHLCDKGFAQKGSYKSHMGMIHKVIVT